MQRIAPLALALTLALTAVAHAAKPRPDLTIAAAGPLKVSSAVPGGKLVLGDTTRNAGAARSRATRTGWYLSLDRVVGRGDRRLGRRSVGALRSRKASKRATTLTLPMLTGDFFLIACADDGNKVRERNERNNCRVVAGRLRISQPQPAPPQPSDTGAPGTGGDPGNGSTTPTDPGPQPPDPTTPDPPPPPAVGGCQIFPASNAWNRDVTQDLVDSESADYVKYMAANPTADPTWNLRLDFGTTEEYYGIPWTLVPENQPLAVLQYGVGDGPGWANPLDVTYEDYADESDPGAPPFPHDIHIEGGETAAPDPNVGDRHAIAIRQGECKLYETYKTMREGTADAPAFQAASFADWDLTANETRPAGWTSADAAGMAIFPGLLRFEEILAGQINHALRFTAPRAQRAYSAPGNHFGPNSNVCYPYYGLRMRLRADFDESPYSAQARVLIRALKTYGLIYADQGSPGFVSGTSAAAAADLISEINGTRRIPSSAFDVLQPGAPIVRGWDPGADTSCAG